MNKKAKINLIVIISLFLLFMLIVPFANSENGDNKINNKESQLINKRATSETWKNPDGTYTKTIYSGIKNVYEDRQWKSIKEARSLKDKGFNIKYIDTDEDYKLNIIDFNLTSIEFELEIKDKDKNKDIDLKVWKLDEATAELNKDKKDKTYKDEAIIIKDKKIKQDKNKEKYVEEFGFDKIIEIGGHSTTITLQDADSENLDDSYVSSNNPDSTQNYDVFYVGNRSTFHDSSSFIKFNLSSLGNNQNKILNSILSLYVTLNVYDGGENQVMSVYGLNNTEWDEESLTYNNAPFSDVNDLLDTNIGLTESLLWIHFDVTTWINKTSSNYNNISFFMNVSNYDEDDAIKFASKEYASSSVYPMLNITYTPYIDIITPTANQIFTEDSPTTYFNVSTAVNMDACRWSPDSGATNYSMTSIDSTHFTLANTSMVDGSHSIVYYCNESSDGTWRTSDQVDFQVDSVNITVCRDLNVDRTYTLLNNISVVDEHCVSINNNLSLYLNDNNLSGGGSFGSRYPVLVNGEYVFSIFNGTVNVADGGGYAIHYAPGFEDYTMNMTLVTITSSSLGIKAGLNSIIRDSALEGTATFSQSIVKVINTTYSTAGSGASLVLERQWYFSPQVNYTHNGTAVSGVNVSIYNVTGNLIHSELTDSNGQITRQELIEYVNNGGTKSYYTNYTINATFTNWNTDSQSINLTTNYLNQQFNIADTTPPTSTSSATSPPDGASYTFNTWTNQNVKVTISASDSGVGYDNLAYPKYCNDSSNTCFPSTYISSGVTLTTEGTTYIRYYSNDTINNNESVQSKIIKIDKTPPSVSIIYPTSNLNLSTNTSINLNFSSSDSNSGLSTCKYSLDGGATNTTISCSANTTINVSEGSITLTLYANDSVNNLNNSESVTFTTDLTNPSISITSPTNNSNSSDTGLDILFTRSDTNLESCWYSNDSYSLNTTLASCNNLTSITWSEGQHNVTIWTNDSSGRQNSSSVSFTIDTISPDISFNANTETNATYKQTGDIFINITASDINKANVSFEWNGVNETFDNSGGNYYWENKTGLSEGAYSFYAWANDSAGNLNTTETRTVYIDLNNPSVSIVLPTSSSYNYNESISLNYTASDTYLDSCWWSIDGEANQTLASCLNTTFNTSEGSHTIYVYANDSSGRESSDSISFTVSLAPPTISLDYPTANQWLNYKTNIGFNYTASHNSLDSCVLYANWTGSWGLNETDTSPNNGTTSTFTKNLTDGNYLWNVLCNDTSNNGAWGSPLSNRTVHIDSTFPLIEFTGTSNNDTNTTNTYIFVNITASDLNEDTITFTLFNSIGSYNTTRFTDGKRNITWSNLPDDYYYYNVTINDSANNINYTETRKITLDDTKPTITIDLPQAQNYGNNNSMELNYTATDNLIGLDECWYYIYNSSGSLIKATETLSNCENDTFTLPGGDIDYTLTLFAKDLLGNTQSSAVTFGIRTESPSITLYPSNDTHKNYQNNHYLNFSVTTNADNISACSLYGNFKGTWILNQTINNPSESTNINFSAINLDEGNYLWNVNCSDNFGTKSWGLNNQTYIIDLTTPNLILTNPSTTTGSQTFTFNTTVSDAYLSTTTCKYSIFNSVGAIDGLSNNVSFNCNELTSATTTSYGTYNLTVYSTDKATNENSSTKSLTTTASSGTTTGGGGTTIVILGEGNWTMQVSDNIYSYEIFMPLGTSRELDLEFENFGEEEREIDLMCEDIEGEICELVEFDNNTIILPVLKDIKTEKDFTITIPEEYEEGDYSFNIVGIDEDSRQKSITVYLNLAGGGILENTITKLALRTKSGFPYIFIYIPLIMTTLFLSVLIIPEKTPIKSIWVILSILIIPFFIIYFV